MASSRRPGGHSGSAIPSTARTKFRCAVAVFVRFLVFRLRIRSAQTSGSAQSGQGKLNGNRSALRAGVFVSGWVWGWGCWLGVWGKEEGAGEREDEPSHASLSSHVTFCDASRAFFARYRSVRIAPAVRCFGSDRSSASISAIAVTRASPVTPAAMRCFTAVAMMLTGRPQSFPAPRERRTRRKAETGYR